MSHWEVQPHRAIAVACGYARKALKEEFHPLDGEYGTLYLVYQGPFQLQCIYVVTKAHFVQVYVYCEHGKIKSMHQ